MKICIFGDVHGNIKQLKKLTETQDFLNADLRICIGDMVGLGPYQKECMDLIEKFNYVMLLGNHEARMTKLIDDLDPIADPDICLQFDINRKRLKKYLPKFQTLPRYYKLTLANKKFYFTHYGWHNDNMSNKYYALRNKSLTEQFGLAPDEYDYVFYGHIHSPSVTQEGKTQFINIGSLGLKCPSNYYMIYEQDGNIEFEHKFLEFDKDEFLKECKKLNYPKWEQFLNYSFDNDLEKTFGTVLVTGGAGYIGTNVVYSLAKQAYKIVVVDNFSNSHKENIDRLAKQYIKNIKVYNFNLNDYKKLEKVLIDENIFSVIHLAGKKYVPESFEKEDEYYKNNVALTKNLLDLLEKHNIKNLVFSSSITVYGKPQTEIVDEQEKLSPLSPYASQKAQGEQLIFNWQKRTNSTAVVLRLSNPVGANTEYFLGDNPKTTKYKNVLLYILDNANANNKLVFNGGNHPTKDGTTIRDYIHVENVAEMFAKAVEIQNGNYNVFNVGSGSPGYSVLDILNQVEKSLDKKLDYSFGPKRDGDASIILTNNTLAKKRLGLRITKNMADMVQSQITFEKNLKSNTKR